ncbi:MAG: FHA domain-containing protein, partial [Gammaproteobacteria bacterium]|nr:FHA domain-containing protein [Gammaproteobacteria bacterium]NIR97935.1 FHA domain-containing protein [Gammaproteobacteria bacterium]NIV20574.1 FHA domain-containing protein [Gammaproteobacteria bacterium]NIY43536.1 FHA domain-containing protein [Gemmatimonadota bacterium]
MTPPDSERRVVAVLRRLDNNQSYMIDRASFRIGREKRSDLIIPDRKISRLHAE